MVVHAQAERKLTIDQQAFRLLPCHSAWKLHVLRATVKEISWKCSIVTTTFGDHTFLYGTNTSELNTKGPNQHINVVIGSEVYSPSGNVHCLFLHWVSCVTAMRDACVHLQVCKFFLQGNCVYGDTCRYDHVKPDWGKKETTSTHRYIDNGHYHLLFGKCCQWISLHAQHITCRCICICMCILRTSPAHDTPQISMQNLDCIP